MRLPVPPTANQLHGRGKFGQYKNRTSRNYEEAIKAILISEGIRPIRKPSDVVIRIRWFRRAKQGDVDNKLKLLLDALQSGKRKFGAYENDSQIKRIEIERFEDPEKKGYLEVSCCEATE